MSTFTKFKEKINEVFNMDKNKTDKAFQDIRICLYAFYNVMKWILSSKRGNNFKFMMLDRYFDILLSKLDQIQKKHDPDYPKSIYGIKSPLDKL